MRNPELILNITTGPGGRFVPSKDRDGSPQQRVFHSSSVIKIAAVSPALDVAHQKQDYNRQRGKTSESPDRQ